MELQADLYAWLQSLGVVADSEIKSRSPTSVLLTPESTRQFESALKLPTLVYRLHALRAAQSPDDSDTNIPALCPLKDSASPLDRLHNWAEVARSLAVHGIILTEEARKRIVSGNLQVVAELLRKIKTAETVLASGQAGRALAENVLSFQDAGSERKTDREMMESKEKPAKREEEENKNRVVVVPRDDPGGAEKQSGPMYVLDIEPTKELGETKTCLEFFLLSLSKCFGLTPSQAAGLLADSNRYLSRILVRGVNKDYSNVTRWLMMLRENAGSFCSLIVAEEGAGAIPMALGTLKGGLFSKDQRTALETCLTLQAVCEELRPYHDQIMKWMLDEGLKAVSELLHLHRGSATVVCEMLISIGATHLKELVTHKLLACCGTSYWELVWELLRQLSPVRSREEMRDIVEFWANEAVKVALSHGCDLRTSAISLLAELWLDFGEAAGDQRAILEVLVKAGSESNNQALQVFAISQLFRILDEFAMEKNPYAPVVYRSLSGLLSETCGEASMREFMMLNFQSFFEANRMAPIDILLVPYLTREEQEPPEWNTFDLEFFERVVGSSKLGERSAFAILEHCARSVMNSFPMAKATALLVLPLLYRLRGHRAAWDFILRTTKVNLRIHQAIGRTRDHCGARGKSSVAAEHQGCVQSSVPVPAHPARAVPGNGPRVSIPLLHHNLAPLRPADASQLQRNPILAKIPAPLRPRPDQMRDRPQFRAHVPTLQVLQRRGPGGCSHGTRVGGAERRLRIQRKFCRRCAPVRTGTCSLPAPGIECESGCGGIVAGSRDLWRESAGHLRPSRPVGDGLGEVWVEVAESVHHEGKRRDLGEQTQTGETDPQERLLRLGRAQQEGQPRYQQDTPQTADEQPAEAAGEKCRTAPRESSVAAHSIPARKTPHRARCFPSRTLLRSAESV